MEKKEEKKNLSRASLSQLSSPSQLAPLSLAKPTPRSILFSRRLHFPKRPYRSYRADAVHSLLPYPVTMETTNAVHPSGRLRADVGLPWASSRGSDSSSANNHPGM
ncbi:hypothetical protein TNCT_80521 [Trichonephila clavata]|uniref:Uncharacterized protein n=1 Tax=Trichonephila clavata TaxID=2740835 RepID=A0A8X6ISF4_TRICU|nr:hypothetical protein TNCT_80521 [Trichonephila clavata]